MMAGLCRSAFGWSVAVMAALFVSDGHHPFAVFFVGLIMGICGNLGWSNER